MRLTLLPFFLLISSFFACGGCGNDPCALGDCPEGLVCIVGEFDDSQAFCVSPENACRPECGPLERCNSDRQCEVVAPQCDSAGEICDGRFATKDGFLCVDGDGAGPAQSTCLEFCREDGTCQSGELCFFVNSRNDVQCLTNTDCDGAKVCDQGLCRDRVCRPSECEGFVEGQQTCKDLYQNNTAFPNGAQCVEVTNGASFCFPAGPKEVGQACISLEEAIPLNDFSQACQSEAVCVSNTCRRGCVENKDCKDDDTCAIGSAATLGFCGRTCTPFSTGECGEGACLPVEKNQGLCVEGGTKKAFEACSPGAQECSDGTLCIPYETNLGRCQPLCDLTAGEANPDGSVGEFPQAQRDATCPQSDPVGAFFRIHNRAELAGGIDVYIENAQSPQISNLLLSQSSDGDTNLTGDQYSEIDPKQYTIKILPSGAPPTDPPLGEQVASLVSGGLNDFFVIPVDQTPDKVEILSFPESKNETPASAGMAKLRVLHTLIDVPNLDLILVPMDDNLSDPTNQIEVSLNQAFKSRSAFLEVPIGTYDILAFPNADPRTTRLNALASASGIEITNSLQTIVIRGSANPDDLPQAGIDLLGAVVFPSTQGSGPRFSCVVLNNDIFGFCQQECFDDGSGFGGDVCLGESMGCNPTFLQPNSKWKNLCGPTGSLGLDEACSTLRTWGECEQGLHCLEFGNSVDPFDADRRGKCQSLCIDGQENHATLNCGQDQACQPFAYNDDYKMGKCNYDCTTNPQYSDASCPVGLKSCKPISSQVPDLNGGTTPGVEVEQPFCSSSGSVAVGDSCAGADCLPGSECIFPRSGGQTTFVASLASQYFGGPGLAPTCTPQCDPFDNDSSAVKCGAGETCLFNFPWSAEVGHCAEITEDVAPLSPCQNAGEACGKDSICILNGGANVCFQFCEYRGPQNGALQSQGCAVGSLCNPFIADIGICQPQ